MTENQKSALAWIVIGVFWLGFCLGVFAEKMRQGEPHHEQKTILGRV